MVRSAEALKTHEHSPSNFKLVSDTNKTIKLATVEKKKKPEPEVNATAKKKFVECQQCPCQLPVHELEVNFLHVLFTKCLNEILFTFDP